MMRVVNRRREEFTHDIGRPFVLGNPFKIGRDANGRLWTRRQVIDLFESWVRTGSDCGEVLAAIRALPPDAVLGCWCKPKPCHGDVIVKLWHEMHAT